MYAYSRVDIYGENVKAQSGTVDSYRWLIQAAEAVPRTATDVGSRCPQDGDGDGDSKTGKNRDHLDRRSALPGCVKVQSF